MTYQDAPKPPEPVVKEGPAVKEDPAPELKLVPIEDLDKVEKLLDVAMNTINTPNLPNIKAACMQELKAIDDSMAEPIQEAQEAYRVALAEWSAKRDAKAAEERKKVDAENKKRSDEARKRGEEIPPDSWVPPRDSLAHPRAPSGPSPVYPREDPAFGPVNGTVDRRV